MIKSTCKEHLVDIYKLAEAGHHDANGASGHSHEGGCSLQTAYPALLHNIVRVGSREASCLKQVYHLCLSAKQGICCWKALMYMGEACERSRQAWVDLKSQAR